MTKESSELKELMRELGHEISNASDEMQKMITINLTLQSKMTELMIEITHLVKNVSEMVALLKEAGEEEESQMDFSPMVKAMEDMKAQNEEILIALQAIDKHLTRGYTREMLGKALGRE